MVISQCRVPEDIKIWENVGGVEMKERLTGPDNGLPPISNKPFPEPILT